jgi:hypothetical protein
MPISDQIFEIAQQIAQGTIGFKERNLPLKVVVNFDAREVSG